jgi:hypothetical protein
VGSDAKSWQMFVSAKIIASANKVRKGEDKSRHEIIAHEHDWMEDHAAEGERAESVLAHTKQ